MKLPFLVALSLVFFATVNADPAPPTPPPAAVPPGNDEPTTEKPKPGNPVQAAKATVAKPVRPKLDTMRTALVPDNSFMPPFDEYDEATGERIVDYGWAVGGDTDVHENFVRLTNDRQSKAGYIHNNNNIAMMDFSMYVNFRISGAGQRLFGDGIAIWITDNTEEDWRRGGTLFAGPADFKGFVVVLDTFKNSEMGSTHKDIMLFVNDGEDDVDVGQPVTGANANYRYFEGRDDFSVLDYSVLHIMYKASTKTLLVMLDEKNTGEFKTVIEHKIESLPRGWDKELRISFSATTGQLADNHDLLSVKLLKAGGRLPRDAEDEVNPREIQSLERQVQKQSGGAQIAKLMKLYRRDQEMRLNHLHHAIEHELSFIQDSLKSAINKIKEAEKDDHLRIEVLEQKAEEVARQILGDSVKDHVADAVEEHVERHVEREVQKKTRKLDDKLASVARENRKAHAKMLDEVDDMLEEAGTGGGGGGAGWITIVVLVAVFGVVVFLLSRRLSRMEKNHLP